PVVRRDDHQPGLRGGEGRQLLQRGGRAVVIDHDLVEHRPGRPPGPDRREVLLGDLDGLVHLLLCGEQGLLDQRSLLRPPPSAPLAWHGRALVPSHSPPVHPAVTSVPILSPRTARATFPSPSTPKTIIGSRLSMHRLKAVASTTRSPRRSASP